MTEETKSQSDKIFETLWSDNEFREYVGNNNIPLEFIINLVDKVSDMANEELKERCKTWETAFKNLDHLYHEVNEEKCKFEIENKSLITRNHIVPEHYLSEAIDRCNELEKQIEKMKCCENCKNHYWNYGELDCRLKYSCYDTNYDKWEYTE